MTPDQIIDVVLPTAVALAGYRMFHDWRHKPMPMSEPMLPPVGAAGRYDRFMHPLRERITVGDAETDFYETHMRVFSMSGGFKALDLDTVLPTPTGWTTVGQVREGDYLCDENGAPTLVLGTSEVFTSRPCYEVAFSDGAHIVTDAEHRWLTISEAARRSAYQAKRNNYRQRIGPSVVTTEEIAVTLYAERLGRKALNHAVPVADALKCDEALLPIDPYLLGAWLGDGHSRGARITSADPDVVAAIAATGQRVSEQRVPKGRTPNYGLPGLQRELRRLGVFAAKHIPVQYLRGSFEQRLALLQGLMDTDGCCHEDGQSVFVTTRQCLANDVLALVSSLGIKAGIYSYPCKGRRPESSTSYRVTFTTNKQVFRLRRKAERLPKHVRATSAYRYVSEVRPVPSRPTRCLMVDSPSHLFLAGREGIPTHNTTLLAYLVRQRIEAGRSVVVMTGGDSDQLETEVRRHGGLVLRPNKSTIRFNPFDGEPRFMAQVWASFFPTTSKAMVYHSAFELAALAYFESTTSYSVRGLKKYVLNYEPPEEDGRPETSKQLWKGMKEGYGALRLELMDKFLGDWIGQGLSIDYCVRHKIPVMFVVDSVDDPDLTRLSAALVWGAICYAVHHTGGVDAVVDEFGRLPVGLVNDQVRTWRRNTSHLIAASHTDRDFDPILEDMFHTNCLGRMTSSATATRKAASDITWGAVHPTRFGAHALGKRRSRLDDLTRQPRRGYFRLVDQDRIQEVKVFEYREPEVNIPTMHILYERPAGEAASSKMPPTPGHKRGVPTPGTVLSSVSPPENGEELRTGPASGEAAGHVELGKRLHGPPEAPAWTALNHLTQNLWQRHYFPYGALDERACWHIHLSLKGKGKRPGYAFRVTPEDPWVDWQAYDLIKALDEAAKQGFLHNHAKLNAFLAYVKLHLKTKDLSGDHLCEKWYGTEAKLCVRADHLGWEDKLRNTELHWERLNDREDAA